MEKYMLLMNVAENAVEPGATISGIGFFFADPEKAKEVYSFAFQYLEAFEINKDWRVQLTFFGQDEHGDYEPTTFAF